MAAPFKVELTTPFALRTGQSKKRATKPAARANRANVSCHTLAERKGDLVLKERGEHKKLSTLGLEHSLNWNQLT